MADKALLIGINEYQTVGGLRGCENDVKNMHGLLTGPLGFSQRNIKTLLNRDANRRNVTKQMQWLFRDARPGDRLVLHFSGHGSYTASDEDGDEDRGTDELICLVDMNFHNRNTYLTDDDLRHWTEELPLGARLLVVLDCCHSGTGTRMVAPAPSAVPVAVEEAATAARAVEVGGTRSALPAAEVATLVRDAFDPQSEQAVLARFVPPPPEIEEKIRTRRRRSLGRSLVEVNLNHVLLAACRDDQTAADAFIEDEFNGAFTYHLCRAVREAGPDADRTELHRLVTEALRTGHFAQEPQFEGPGVATTLFGGRPAPSDGPPRTESNGPAVRPTRPALQPAAKDRDDLLGLLTRIVGPGERLSPEERSLALGIFSKLVTGEAAPARARRAVAGRYLVYVHGVCEHPPGYSDDWWRALRPFVGDTFGDGTLDEERREVLWSDLVNERALAMRDVGGERAEFRREIREILEERVDEQTVQAATARAGATSPAAPEMREILVRERGLSLPGMGCIDDFTVYMTNEGVRGQVLERFTRVVRPLLEEGAEVDLISHSWGTVVAYEGLRALEDAGFTRPLVRTLFTVGAALSIGPVRWRLRRANSDGRKPAPVRRWINLDAQWDPVGGPLARHFRVDDEFLGLDPVGCTPNLFGICDPSCAHSSYFAQGNDRVNRGIFAHFING